MNRTVFSLPAQSEYLTAGGLSIGRSIEHFTGGSRLDDLIGLLDSRRGVVLSSGTTVPGRGKVATSSKVRRGFISILARAGLELGLAVVGGAVSLPPEQAMTRASNATEGSWRKAQDIVLRSMPTSGRSRHERSCLP